VRLARAAVAAAVAFAPAVAALPARAAECVRVVVDYGTSSGANTHCTSSDGTAAEVLARRATELGKPAPRYNGNFLCGVDGYPESGCGDHGTEPYWSLWYWVNGAWVYSSQGVDSYTVRDADKDGHPDPIGFRYTPFKSKERPRANPSYAPATQPPVTRPPSTSRPVPTRTGTATRAPGATSPPPVPPSGSVGATTTTAPGTTASATSAGSAPPTTAPGAPVSASATETFAAPPVSPRRGGGGFPAGTVVGVLLALGLLGAAAARTRAGRA